jgi:hypothetical protein
MGRFETQWLAASMNLSALADLSGQWIDLVHGRRPPRGIVLDMDSSVSPTHGEQENSCMSDILLIAQRNAINRHSLMQINANLAAIQLNGASATKA